MRLSDYGRLYLRLWKGCLSGLLSSSTPVDPRCVVIMALFIPLFLVFQTVHWIALLLDEVFFPGYRRIEIRQPVFIVGVPRSGTTFLHRVLSQDRERFTTTALWELLFAPSVIEKKIFIALSRIDLALGGPAKMCLERIERLTLGGLDSIHQVSLQDPEEDYFYLLPVFSCFLIVLAYPHSEMIWQLSQFDKAVDPLKRQRIMAFYKSCLQRHLYVHGPEKTVLSKNPAFCFMVESLNEAFADCRIISTVRSPLFTVPSLLSSMKIGLEIFNPDKEWEVFSRRLVNMLSGYYDHLAEKLPDLPQNRHNFVHMKELTEDVRAAVVRIYNRLELDISPGLRTSLDSFYHQSRTYKSNHKYTLNQFGLSAADIHKQFAHAFQYFNF